MFSAPIIRRSTRGPLDINETPITHNPHSPLNPSTLLSPTSSTSRLRSPAARSPRLQSPNIRSPRYPGSPSLHLPKDFSHLLRPEVYHPLPHLDIAAPFRTPASQPNASTPLATLLATGRFRAAAIAAASQLTNSQPAIAANDHSKIFALLYVRLSCLCLCDNTALAAQEVLALEDLNSAYYRDDSTGLHLVPWELRVLAVRLQGMGFNDARRGVMGYYDLGREARSVISRLKIKSRGDGVSDEERERFGAEVRLWEARLADLGIRVAGALIEMEDLDGAACFLKTLKAGDGSEMEMKRALLWLCLGDIDAARSCITDREGGRVIEALALMADGSYDQAVGIWQGLVDSESQENEGEREMWKGNLGVSLLYAGRLDEARTTLESLIDQGHTFHALTFNLCTLYELCTERSRALKLGLADKIAGATSTTGEEEGDVKVRGVGWEKVNGDFKL